MLKYFNYDIVFQEIPDEVTLAINLSNCPNRCPGCHSPHLAEDIGEVLTGEVLEDLILKYGQAITCICFMGGDAAPDEVNQLAIYVHSRSMDMKVGWYSGRATLPANFSLQPFNYIKLGAYIEKLGGLRSSGTNQRLYKINEGQVLEDITYLYICRSKRN